MNQDLTVGRPSSVVVRFTLPLFISVIFQQLYNIADSMIAGRFAGEDALAAVGASYPITMLFMAVAIGSNIGCSVVISALFGGREYRQIRTAVSTVLLTTCALSVVLTVGGLLGTSGLMRLIQTPQNIFADGALYLRIYIGGFIFVYLYNVITGIFTALGDSKTPLYFLIGSSVGNIVLDYIFVAVFRWGVAGVAWATFIAQGVAGVLALFALLRRMKALPDYEGHAEWFSLSMLGRIAGIAIPSILQQSSISVGNVLIQGLVNSFGSAVIAGYSAAIKLNTFAITGFITLGNGISTFTAQNLGARKSDRVAQGLRAGLVMGFAIAVPFFLAYFFAGNTMIGLFLKEGTAAAFETGRVFLRIVTPFYFVILIKLVTDGVLRGSGAMNAFLVSTFTDLVLRVVLAFLIAGRFGTVGIWCTWPIGWTVATVMTFWYYCSRKWMKKWTK
ncbi:MAG: MATE family efflux transporter [Oscillospiraceae bacterium]|nr:MATE family efflux transporter [Oscillospiraceae bacterium]